MVTPNFLFTVVGVFLLVLTSCAPKAKVKSDSSAPHKEISETSKPTTYSPRLSERPPSRLAVVLSPGGARTFAELGVLKELVKARAPIEAVVGVEWGSLIAALYAQNGQIHEAEWKLYKLQAKDLLSRSLFGNSRPESVKSLDGFFQENLRGRSLSQSPVRFGCPSLSVFSGTFQWQDRGEFAEAVKKCLPSPPILRPAGPWAASLVSSRDTVQWLKRQGYSTIVLVDVLRSPDYLESDKMIEDFSLASLYLEMRKQFVLDREQYDDVLEIDARGFRVTDFEKRKELVNLGERLGRPQVEALTKKYGW